MSKAIWAASDVTGADYVGILEFQDVTGDWHDFTVLSIGDRLLFGGETNTGFLESGYILKDGEETEGVLLELLADLEVYYNEGPSAVSRIVCNQRM